MIVIELQLFKEDLINENLTKLHIHTHRQIHYLIIPLLLFKWGGGKINKHAK